MCQQEHTPVRQVQQRDGNLAFKCNCGKFHPFSRMQPNEMDVTKCISKDDIVEEPKQEKIPAVKEFKKGRWGMAH